MTAKTLSWTTFGLLTIGAFPFVANPEVSPSLSSDTFLRQSYSGTILPACGACSILPDQNFIKNYAIDINQTCPPATPYRLAVHLATKVFCENGTYWVCDDSSSLACSVFLPRPACLQDSCKRGS